MEVTPVWKGPNGELIEYEPIWLGLDDDGHEVFTHRGDGIAALPPEKPLGSVGGSFGH